MSEPLDSDIPATLPPHTMRPQSAALWAVSARLMSQAMRFFTSVIMARLLTPSEFGLVAMAMTFSGFASVLTDVGLRAAVVQFRDLNRAGVSTTFWISAIIGTGITLALSLCSHLIADLSRMPELFPILIAIATGLLLTSLTAVPLGLLNRRMEFQKTSLIEIACEGCGACIAVAMAIYGARYWALVAQSLVVTSMMCVLCYTIARWRPTLEFDYLQARRIVLFSANLLGFNTLNYWARNLDNLLIGRYFGSGALGYYSRAYSLMMYPYSMLHTSISPVLHSSLSSMQQDIPRMKHAYMKLAKLSLMASLPIAAIFSVLAKPLILSIFGPQWLPSVASFRLLCVVTAIQPLMAASGNVYIARGRADLLFKLGSIYIIIVCLGFAIGLRWGIEGVAAGYAVANLLVIPPTLSFIVRRLLGGSNSELLHKAVTPTLSAAIAALSAAASNRILNGLLPMPIRVLTALATSAIMVIVTLRTIDRAFARECIDMLPTPIALYLLNEQ